MNESVSTYHLNESIQDNATTLLSYGFKVLGGLFECYCHVFFMLNNDANSSLHLQLKHFFSKGSTSTL